MYDNILHKPLALRPGASSTAWSLLQGLLEKDGQHRLGSRDDFVSAYFSMHLSKYRPYMQQNFFFLGSLWWLICINHNTTANNLQMYFIKLTFEKYKIMFFYSAFSEWDQSPQLLLLHQLGWPCTEEDPSSIYTQSGEYLFLAQ